MCRLSKGKAVPILKTYPSSCPTTLQTFLHHLHPSGKSSVLPTYFPHNHLSSSQSQRTTSFNPSTISDLKIPSNSVQPATTYSIPPPSPPPVLQYAPYPHAKEWGTPHLLLDSPPMSYHKATPTPQSSIMEPGTTSPGFPPNPPCPNPSHTPLPQHQMTSLLKLLFLFLLHPSQQHCIPLQRLLQSPPASPVVKGLLG